jgi:phage-related protein (TIGR01555 family)
MNRSNKNRYKKKAAKVSKATKSADVDIDYDKFGHKSMGFSTHRVTQDAGNTFNYNHSVQVPAPTPDWAPDKALDSVDYNNFPKFSYRNTALSPALACWYNSQGFIGYDLCSTFAQYWLIDKACTVKAEDAVRKGYEITINGDVDLGDEKTEIIAEMKKLDGDEGYNINAQMIDFVRSARIFGIRHALFLVDTGDDEEYYKNPFNINSIKPGSYKGIVQVEARWLVPQLDLDATANPISKFYYVPTYWQVAGIQATLIHRSHFVINIPCPVSDLLKPTYLYGGISLTQKIYERVYAADRMANESPMLSLTKRTMVHKLDTKAALSNECAFIKSQEFNQANQDNYGVKIVDTDDEIQQFDINLSGLDDITMTQYQIVAAISATPAVKLMETQPKGFNATGEYEEASYNASLESIQDSQLKPLLSRHYKLMLKSDVFPKFSITEEFEVTPVFEKLDAMTEEEQARVKNIESQTDVNYVNAGILDNSEIREKIIADEQSGYNGLEVERENGDQRDLDQEALRIEENMRDGDF